MNSITSWSACSSETSKRWCLSFFLMGGQLAKATFVLHPEFFVAGPLRQSALFSVEGNSLAKAYGDRTNAFRYYLTGGVMANGQAIRHIYDSPLDPGCVDRGFVNEGQIRLPLKKFLAQPRLFYDGHWFNTGQILRFVANKLGGNHIDFDRPGEWERLDAANAYMRQMEIGGVQLCTLRSERSLRDRLRRLFRQPAAIRMID